MIKSVEIRVGKKGFIVSARGGAVYRFEGTSSQAAKEAIFAAEDGEAIGLHASEFEKTEFHPAEWGVSSADEALSIARKLLEGEQE